MVLEPYQSDLLSNGPIVRMPNWPSPSSPRPLPPDDEPDTAGNPNSETANPQAGAYSDPLNPEPRTLNPSRRGRPRVLDEYKQATICNLIAGGVTLRQAADFVDCDASSIRREAQRNDDFRRQLAKARSEASIHPLHVLRQAAKSNWRAALCWMERLDPKRFARPDASVVTKRESNQFVADLVESIERAVPDTQDRANLYELLSAAMPAAMRRRWDGHASRRGLKQAMRDFETKRNEQVEQRAKRRREFTARIASYLPWQLIRELGDYNDVLDPDVIAADCAHAAARQIGPPRQPQNDGDRTDRGLSPFAESAEQKGTVLLPNSGVETASSPLNDGPPNDDPPNDGPPNDDATSSAPDGLPILGRANFASPGENFAAPPRRNSDNFASPRFTNRQPGNDL